MKFRINTPRMELISVDKKLLWAEMKDRAVLEDMLEADVPMNWPPEMMIDTLEWSVDQLQKDSSLVGWLAWYWVLREGAQGDRFLIGSGGFKGKPDENGAVEIGYSLLPQYQGYGYGMEGVAALLDWAFSREAVKCVVAETYPVMGPSIQLLEKCGFASAGKGSDPSAVRYELHRERYRKPGR